MQEEGFGSSNVAEQVALANAAEQVGQAGVLEQASHAAMGALAKEMAEVLRESMSILRVENHA